MRISDWSSDVCFRSQVVDHLHLSCLQSFLIQCSDGNRRGLKRLTSAARCNEDVLNLAASLRGGSGRRGLRQRHTGKRQGNSRNAKDRKSGVEGRSVSVTVEPGGGRIIKKK